MSKVFIVPHKFWTLSLCFWSLLCIDCNSVRFFNFSSSFLSLDISSFIRVNSPSSVSEHSDTSVNLSGVFPGLPGELWGESKASTITSSIGQDFLEDHDYYCDNFVVEAFSDSVCHSPTYSKCVHAHYKVKNVSMHITAKTTMSTPLAPRHHFKDNKWINVT